MSSEFDRDAELAFVHRVIERSSEAVRRFVDRMECVFRMLAGLNVRSGRVLDPEELADLVQDVRVRVLERLHEFEGRSELEGWVYRICQFEFLNRARRVRRIARRRVDVESAFELAGEVAEERVVVDREYLARALEQVGGLEADLIAMKHFEGLTFQEMSRRLEQPVSTIKSRYYEGLKRLRAILKRGGFGGGAP